MSTQFESYEGGYLELIIGPMFSGKTSRLLEIYKQCKFCNIQIAVINHVMDNRYDEDELSTHDKIKIPCIKANSLTQIWRNEQNNENIVYHSNLRKANVILINEGQLFEDLFDNVNDMVNCGKKVYICGLDGDFKRNKFGSILDLIPLCDKVTKFTSICSLCKNGTPGIFSMRLTNEKEQIIIGTNNYIPVCRECYKKNNNNK
jgi:thymidine kinase